jgi:hypothetical protein
MNNTWIVQWIDDEHDDIQYAPFISYRDAMRWIKNKYDASHIEPDGFEAISMPYCNG